MAPSPSASVSALTSESCSMKTPQVLAQLRVPQWVAVPQLMVCGQRGCGGKHSPGEMGVPTLADGPTPIRGSLAGVSSGTGAVDVGPQTSSQRLVTELVSTGTCGNSNFLCPQKLTEGTTGLTTKSRFIQIQGSYTFGFWSQAQKAAVLSLH